MIQCERGHFYDENRYSGCPYCSQVSNQPRSVTPPVAPNMEIPTPSCGKTVAVEGVETEPTVGKTVAIDGFVDNPAPVNKTVAISEPPLDFPPVTPIAAPAPAAPQYQTAPAQYSAPQAVPAPVPAAVPLPAESQIPASAPVMTPAPAQAPAPAFVPQNTPVTYSADINASIPFSGVSETPERVLTEEISIDLPVTGLGVTEHPQPIAQEEKFYHSDPERPYAVTGLGVKENPTPIPNDVGATFPIPNGEGSAASASQPGQAEAAAFAAFGFPGGPIPGMMPGAPVPGAAPAPAQTPVSEPSAPQAAPIVPVVDEVPVTAPAPVIDISPSEPEVEASPVVEEVPVSEPAPVPAPVPAPTPAPVFAEPEPRDPNATVSLTESDMDYLPRIHARAFLVCIDGPMTGASYVFQESRAIIGRQKNYEIALYRDNSVSRSPHAIINYYRDALRYTVSTGDEEKKVSVNGSFITSETDLKMYDVIGIGQTRLLFIPVCSEKFAW